MTRRRQTPVSETALEAELRSLPDATKGKTRQWTKEQDRLILKYVPLKGSPAVAAILNVAPDAVRRHYNALKLGQK